MQKHTFTRFLVALSTVFSTFVLAQSASADTVNLTWSPNPEPQVIGYKVHMGTQSGTYTQHIDVGPTTTWSFTSPVVGQMYCFVVTAYVAGPLEGARSAEACGYGNAPPVLTNPGTQSAKVGQAASLQLVGSDAKGDVLTYSATGLPPGLSVMASTGYISGTPTTAGNYSVKANASDGVMTASQTFTWGVTTVDTTAPVVTITGPTSAAAYSTTAATMSLGGTASDNVGVTQVAWVNNRGGSGNTSGTTSWAASIALQAGSNLLTVTARDAAGNTSSDTLTVTMTAASDTTAPAVTITSPTTAATFKTGAATVTLGGIASDNVSVTQVSWANNRGGSGTASGTTSWSTAVTLQTGANVLTATARDAVGNTKTASITVTLNTPPTLSGVASQTTAQGTAASMQLSAADPDGDVLTYGASGLPPGIAIAVSTGLVAGTPSTAGSYPVTVTVSDGMQTATRTFTWTVTAAATDTVAPAVAITTPTTATTFSTSGATLSLGGTASDNVGVTQVTWSNSSGGSGTATGTASWSASVALQSGSNVLTVTARDAAGNTSTDTLTVTYTPAASYTVKITSDKASPQKAGVYVVFTVTTTGGVSPFSYQWRLFDGVSWKVFEPWRSDGVRTTTWRVPTVKGTYTMEASARDKNGAIATTTVPFQVN
jgi:hypothetical protein